MNKIASAAQQLIATVQKLKKSKAKYKTADLSDREIEIIKLICEENTNKQIASKLFISVRTVDGHREKILHKTNAKNTVGIVMYAIKNNLLEK
jgi:DNA-binding CsgD family transcriptional regulator